MSLEDKKKKLPVALPKPSWLVSCFCFVLERRPLVAQASYTYYQTSFLYLHTTAVQRSAVQRSAAQRSMADIKSHEPENGLDRTTSTVDQKDEQELAHFGYRQELRRDWGLMHNFGISFSIIVRPLCYVEYALYKSRLIPLCSPSSLVSQLFSSMVLSRVVLEVKSLPFPDGWVLADNM